jgi:hypothetical protein
MQNKTHYRKVFKSDHLGSADLEELLEEGKSLIFNIKEVKQEIGAKVAGKKIDANIAYFYEKIKPMVVNATNSKTLKKMSGSPFVEDWKNMPIELYIDERVQMKGETVGGIRIKEEPPKPMSKDELSALSLTLSETVTLEELTKLYNSDIKYKVSKEAITLFSTRSKELKK